MKKKVFGGDGGDDEDEDDEEEDDFKERYRSLKIRLIMRLFKMMLG